MYQPWRGRTLANDRETELRGANKTHPGRHDIGTQTARADKQMRTRIREQYRHRPASPNQTEQNNPQDERNHEPTCSTAQPGPHTHQRQPAEWTTDPVGNRNHHSSPMTPSETRASDPSGDPSGHRMRSKRPEHTEGAGAPRQPAREKPAQKREPRQAYLAGLMKPAVTYFPAEQYHRRQGLNCCVRDGNRCFPLSMFTGKSFGGFSAAEGVFA